MQVDLYIATVLKLAAVMKLTAGIYAIQAPDVPLTVDRAAQYAVAATYHGQRAGIDPYELVAIARNESDFIENMRGPDGKDCGMMQTRVTITKYSCRQLLHSYWLDFQEGAREMKEYSAACKTHADFDRCRLNHYNSGVHYAKSGFHGAYWLRVQCFEKAARDGISVGHACRHVMGRGDIARVLKKGLPRKREQMIAQSTNRPTT